MGAFKPASVPIRIIIYAAILITGTTQLQAAFGVGAIGKLMLALIFFLLGASLFASNKIFQISRTGGLSLLACLALVLNATYSFFILTPPNQILTSFSQLFFIYFWILIFESLNPKTLKHCLRFTAKLITILLAFSLIELVTPTEMKTQILSRFFGGIIPASYYSRDLSLLIGEFFRLGSLLFSPLTFAYCCVFMVAYTKIENRKYLRYTAYFFSLASQVKTSIVGAVMLAGDLILGRITKLCFWAIIFVVASLSASVTGSELLNIPNSSPLKSLSNHFVGLVSGIRAGFEKPLFGNGLGTSGYLIYLDTLESAQEHSPFSEESPFLNGNESTLGVISYQLGILFTLLHVSIIYSYILFFSKFRNHLGNTFALFLLIFQLLSESPLTLLISLTTALILSSLKSIPREEHEAKKN